MTCFEAVKKAKLAAGLLAELAKEDYIIDCNVLYGVVRLHLDTNIVRDEEGRVLYQGKGFELWDLFGEGKPETSLNGDYMKHEKMVDGVNLYYLEKGAAA